MTALHYATVKKDVTLVNLLIRNGARPLVRNIDGKSPFSLANAEIAGILQEAIANVSEVVRGFEKVEEVCEEEEERTQKVEKSGSGSTIEENEDSVGSQGHEIATPPRTRSGSSSRKSVQKPSFDGKARKEFENLSREVQEELAEIRGDFEVRIKEITATLLEVRGKIIEKKRRGSGQHG
jgi:hypothetical protein